jgi:hypothetical protein
MALSSGQVIQLIPVPKKPADDYQDHYCSAVPFLQLHKDWAVKYMQSSSRLDWHAGTGHVDFQQAMSHFCLLDVHVAALRGDPVKASYASSDPHTCGRSYIFMH